MGHELAAFRAMSGCGDTDLYPDLWTTPALQVGFDRRVTVCANLSGTPERAVSWLAKARMRGDGPPYAKFGRAIRYPENVLINYTRSRLRLSTSQG